MGPISLLCSIFWGAHWCLFIGFVPLCFVYSSDANLITRINTSVFTGDLYWGVLFHIIAFLALLFSERLILKNTHILPWKVNFYNVPLENLVDGSFRKALAKMLCPVFDPIVRVTDWIANLVGKTFFFIIIMAPIVGIPSLSYPLAIYRWFATDHQAFWHGFKELLWALAPLINISYVWDIWWDVILVIYFVLKPLILFIIDLFRDR